MADRAVGKCFDGLGAMRAGAASQLLVDYLEPERRHILDYVLTPNYGEALPHFQVNLGGDHHSNDVTKRLSFPKRVKNEVVQYWHRKACISDFGYV